MAVYLRQFIPWKPDDIIHGPYGDWIILILLCGMFIAIAGAVLPKRLTEKRYGKALVVFAGLILGIGLFSARKVYKFNFESFGFIAIWLILLMMVMIVYGLTKVGMNKTTAAPLTYCVIFLSFFMLSPSIFDTISQTMPLLNGIFIFSFIFLIGKLFWNFINPKPTVEHETKDLKHSNIDPEDADIIDAEIVEDKSQIREIKKETINPTKKEIKSIEQVDKDIIDIIHILEKSGNNLNRENKDLIAKELMDIGKIKEHFLITLDRLKRFNLKYKIADHKRVNELRERFHKAEDRNKKILIQKEWTFEKKKADIIQFVERETDSIKSFFQIFEKFIGRAITLIKLQRIKESIQALNYSRTHLDKIKDTLKTMKRYEFYLMKIDKKDINKLVFDRKNK